MNGAAPADGPLPDIRLPGLGAVQLHGWSDREPRLRWTLGKQTSLSFSLAQAQTVTLDYRGLLPFPQQELTLSLNGQTLAQFHQPVGDWLNLSFAQNQQVQLKPGLNVLTFSSNRSRADGPTPGTEGDRRDLGVQLNRFSVLPVSTLGSCIFPKPMLEQHCSEPTGVFPGLIVSSYLPVAPSGLTVHLNPSGQPQLLHYALLPGHANQRFIFSLDGTVTARFQAVGGGLLNGELPLTPSTRLRTLNIQAEDGGRAQHTEFLNVSTLPPQQISFYVQQLDWYPGTTPVWISPWLALPVLMLALWLSWLLLRPRKACAN